MLIIYKKKLFFKSKRRSFSIDFTATGWQAIAGMLAFIGFVSICGFLEAV